MSTQTNVLMVSPEALLADDNVRYGLKKFRVDSLADDITEVGRVHTALKVTPLAEPGPNGEQYRVREGHYRLAAVNKLNKSGAGLQLPVIVEAEGADGLERLKLQLSENLQRNELSPMDIAVAIQKLLDLGVAKVDIRKVFSRPGGRKGLAMQPISNSLLNIYVSFLDFSKSIQNKIHDGTLGVSAAYELAKAPAEKQDTILARAEKERQDQISAEEKDEEKFLENEHKAEESKLKAEQEKVALAKAKELAEKAAADSKERADSAAEAYKKMSATAKADKDARKEAEEAFAEAEKARKTAEKVAAEQASALQKLQEKAQKNAILAAERKQKLEDARKESAKKSVKPEDVKRAAAKESGGVVALNATEMRKVVHDLQLPGSFPKVIKIFGAIERCFSGITTDQQLMSEVAWLTGERREKPKHIKKEDAQ